MELLQQADFVRLLELAPFERGMGWFSPFEKELSSEGYLHSKHMWRDGN